MLNPPAIREYPKNIVFTRSASISASGAVGSAEYEEGVHVTDAFNENRLAPRVSDGLAELPPVSSRANLRRFLDLLCRGKQHFRFDVV